MKHAKVVIYPNCFLNVDLNYIIYRLKLISSALKTLS